jgi:hypothetical protein
MMLYRCPYPPFPFPTYHPDTGTGSGKRNVPTLTYTSRSTSRTSIKTSIATASR